MLHDEGYTVFSSRNTLNSLKSQCLSLLPPGYVFLDYKYTIEGPALFTYHRDVTSSKSSLHTKWPTYTIIHYEYDGDLLSVSPYSHLRWTFSLPITISGKKDTCVLFDSDIVHCGLDAPPHVDRKATQYKLAHIDDLAIMSDLQGIDVVQTGVPVRLLYKTVLRALSYVFTVPIPRFLLQRRSTNILLSGLQQLFPLQYFNSKT